MNDLNTPLLDAALIELKTELRRAEIELATARPANQSVDSSNRAKQFRERIRATIRDLETYS
jgi:hypothetical protein